MHWARATLAFLFGFALSQPAFAGFQEGFDAFRQNDFLTAMAEFLPIAERGDSGAAILVGILYANGYGLDGPDMDQAAHWFNAAADAGETPVMVVKGALMGMGRKHDEEFAAVLAHFGPRAEAGYPESQFLMAWLTTNGLGMGADDSAGLALLRSAADGNFGPAQFQLATIMLDGRGGAQDEAAAAAMFMKAAEGGHAAAQNALSLLYATGRGVQQDQDLSAEWAIKAGRQGNAEAQLFVSGLYRDGMGVARDHVQAFSWAVLAANQNFGPAQLRLASFYANGIGVEVDLFEAYFWWVLGTLAAYGEYSPPIDSLREALTAVIAEADRTDLENEAMHWLGVFNGEL